MARHDCHPAAGAGERFGAFLFFFTTFRTERTLKANDRTSKTPIKFTLVSEQGPRKHH